MPSYSQEVDFSSSAKVKLRWPDFKLICSSKSIPMQYITRTDSYTVFSLDESIVYVCDLILPSNSSGFPFGSDMTQADNDSWVIDFEANYKSKGNRSLVSRTTNGIIRSTSEKTSGTRINFFTHNFTDKTTWYLNSIRVVAETAVNSGNNITYTLAHTFVIDTYHGKLTFEDDLKDSNDSSYRVVVRVANVVKTEQDPHYGSGGDYTINYAAGSITFLSAQSPSAVITVTYYYATSSCFTVKPAAGTSLLIDLVESQFSTDVYITDSIIFEVWGIADYFLTSAQLSAYGIPPGVSYLIRLQRNVYKTMGDFFNDTFKSYPVYPTIGSVSSWRSQTHPVAVMEWDYLSSVLIHASKGMEIRVFLEHDEPFTGYLTTATFYCLASPE